MKEFKATKINSGYYLGFYKNIKFIVSKNSNNIWMWSIKNDKHPRLNSKKEAMMEVKNFIDNL